MPEMRIGNGFDVHPFVDDPSRPLVIAGVEVAGGPPLAGHSDADVAVHAVADALLGALAWGDLGSRVGIDEPSNAGADSLELLRAIVADVAAAGWRVGNADLTVVAQRPRLAALRDEMRARLADALDTGIDRVAVKFTTTDSLGAIGRGEGIAAWASCVLVEVDR